MRDPNGHAVKEDRVLVWARGNDPPTRQRRFGAVIGAAVSIYHLTTRNVTRSKGHSAVHKAAYIARTQLHDERTGLSTPNYRDEEAVKFSGIFAPEGAPSWTRDREQLWNRVEAPEKRKDARVAREVEIALPHELTDQQREWLVKDFVREQFVRNGMVADVSIHTPSRNGDQRNYHAHILLTTRVLDGDGFGPKNRDWNSKEQLQEWRAAWSRTTNRYMERFGHEVKIDHRTLEAQGIDREPSIHLGVQAAAMEARGIETDRGEQLRAIEARNRLREEVTELWQRTDSGKAFRSAVEERGYLLAQGDLTPFCLVDGKGEVHGLTRLVKGAKAEAIEERLSDLERSSLPTVKEAKEHRSASRKDEEQKAGHAKDLSDPQLQQQLDQQLGQLRAMQERRALEDAYLAQRSREAEEAKRARQFEGEITNAQGRYAQALGQHYDARDPYSSLARSATAEHARFMQERQTLSRQIAQEKDPAARHALELRQRIEGAEYMALTDRRIASQSVMITGKLNSSEAVKFRERAAAFEQEAKQLREQYREPQLSRERGGVSPQTEGEKARDGKLAPTQDRPAQAEREQSGKVPVTVAQSEAPLLVADRRNGNAPVPLAEYVKSLPERGPAKDATQQRLEQRRGDMALDDIGKRMKTGRALDGEDVKNLPRRDLEQIKQQGESHLRQRVQERQQAKEQARSMERTPPRERER